MTSQPRFVVLGLAAPSADWFRTLGQWSTAGNVPIDFVKCVSVDELRARLASTRQFSAALLDADLGAVDRDLIAAVQDAGCAAVILDRRRRRDWSELGASATLDGQLDREELLDVLKTHSRLMIAAETIPGTPSSAPPGHRGSLVTLCGPGGGGSSLIATALAQGMAPYGSTVLCDFARNAQQAVLHDARDLFPGVSELTELYRHGRPESSDVRAKTFLVEQRGYHLLLGLRQSHAWGTLRIRAFEAALDGLRSAFDVVVADSDADVEGARQGGSTDVEDRNLMARCTLLSADAILVVGWGNLKGVHSLTRTIGDLVALGAEGQRIVPVINRSPRRSRWRAETAKALAELTASVVNETNQLTLPSPIFLPEREVEGSLRDGGPLPDPLVRPVVAATKAVLQRCGPLGESMPEPLAVRPGSLGHWNNDDVGGTATGGAGVSWA